MCSSTLLECPICAPDLFSSAMVPLFGNFFTTGTNEKVNGFGGKPIETWGNKERKSESVQYVLLLLLETLIYYRKIILEFEESLFKLKPQGCAGNALSSFLKPSTSKYRLRGKNLALMTRHYTPRGRSV